MILRRTLSKPVPRRGHQVTSAPSEYETDDGYALQEEGAGDDEEHETEELHAIPSVEDLSIAATDAVSPARFYARLRELLTARGFDYDALPRLTKEGDSPACFEAANLPFDAWLSSASQVGALVPYRFDMPAEPNYCHDCRADFRRESIANGTCRFPNTRFEKQQVVIQEGRAKVIETEVVGVSRSRDLAIEAARRISQLEY